MFEKILVANRGEVALRIMRAARELGVKTVAVYSTEDADTYPVRYADEVLKAMGHARIKGRNIHVEKATGRR